MKEKNSKRVVIIDDIDSGSIEQAIFILRSSGIPQKSAGASIVSEAERIINAYVQTMEKTRNGISRREKRSRRRNSGRNGTSVAIGLACLMLAGILAVFLANGGAGL